MERAAGKVKPAVFDRSFLAVIFLTFFFCSSFVFARSGADYLIVEKPQNLSILNKYQQEVSQKEREVFVPFGPMKILHDDEVLTDGYTRCMKIDIGGAQFFLLKNSDGKLTRSASLGFERTFHGSREFLDTIQILRNNSIQCSLFNVRRFSLQSGQKALRVFDYQNKTYCRILNGTSFLFGWINFSRKQEGKDWKRIAHEVSTNAISSDILQQIQHKTDEVNSLLSKLFDYLDSATHRQKISPQWKVNASGDRVICELQGNYQSDKFQQSTLYLAKDIQNIVLSSNLQVEHLPGKITIKLR